MALLILLAIFQFPGLMAQKTIEVESFDAVTVAGNIVVLLKPGDTERVEVEVRGAPQDELKVKTLRGELRISWLNSLIYKDYDAEVTVYYQTLRAVRGSAGARISAAGPLKGDKIELRAASGARMDFEIAANAVDGSASEGAVLRLSGAADTQRCSAVTGGQYEAFDLKSKRTYARAHTGGQMQVSALEALEASAHTGGTVEYAGDPEVTVLRNIISGDVRKRTL